MSTHRDLADQAMQQAITVAATDPARASILAGIAQTHATLELAEQQRIANLIALERDDVLFIYDADETELTVRLSSRGYPLLSEPFSHSLGAP